MARRRWSSEEKVRIVMEALNTSISIVEHGRRICLYALPVKQLDQKHEVLMRLLEYANMPERL